MKLSFKCLAVTHTSGRVTLTPLELPTFAVHAASLDEARFELTLALDDRIGRSHPRHLWRYCNPGTGELIALHVPVLPVQGEEVVTTPLALSALESPAQTGHVTVQGAGPRLAARIPAISSRTDSARVRRAGVSYGRGVRPARPAHSRA